MTNEGSKRRRLRGELRAIKRLLPYVRPYTAGVVLLVVVTLIYAGANAGRAWLLKPLLNSVLVHGSAAHDAWTDKKIAQGANTAAVAAIESAAMVGFPHPGEEKDLGRADAGMGESPIRADAPIAEREHDLARLLQRSRQSILEARDQVFAAETDKKFVGRLMKVVRYQRAAEALVGSSVTTMPPAQQAVTAAISLAARDEAGEITFRQVKGDLKFIFAIAMVIAVLLGSFNFFMFYLARALVTRMCVDIQNILAEHLLTLSIRYFNQERRGELFSRLTNDLNQLQAVLMLILSDVLIQPLQLVVLVGAAVYVSPPLSLSIFVLAFTVVIPVRYFGKKIRRSARSRQGSIANVFEAMQQMFAGIRIVKAFRREQYEMERFREKTTEYLDTSLRVVRDRTASRSIMEFVNDVTIPFVLLVGGLLVVNHTWGLDLGSFGEFMVLVVMMYMPAKTLASSYNTLQDAIPSVDRVFEILDTRAEIGETKDAVALGKLTDAIRFEDVTFGYLEGVPVLRDVKFEAKAGEVTAIVGPTTAGKSTLVDLIARFYDPTRGRVTIDGVDLKQAKLSSLLDKIAVVTQDPFLFNDTVKENIRYGRLDATDAEVEAAARAAKIHDDIVLMPQGYDTNVGERGAKLSGGQRQRITIARAILKNPEILILDEAMSSLDATTERRVQEALEELEHGRTTFAIAHRLSTVQHAHKILVLCEGRLVEEGRHEDLVARGGLYASLVKDLAMHGANGNGSSAQVPTTTVEQRA